jgi:hypothetical protein
MSEMDQEETKQVKVVIACRVMEPELERVRNGDPLVEIRYLDQGLHRTPQKMAALVQEHVDEAAQSAGQVVIGYGLCSNGIVGVTARGQGLFVPRCHDCIALFLGSPEAYRKAFEAKPGTYYLTPGWIAEKKDPLGILQEEYTPKFGEETSLWVMEEELKHYTHIAFINTGFGDIKPLEARAKENAAFFKKAYEEIPGSLDYFVKLIRGPHEEREFFYLAPGQEITQDIYLADAMACVSDQ